MATPSPCVPCCATAQTVNVPGIQGDAGADGDDGVNAYSTLSVGFNSAGVGTGHTLTVDNSLWMAVGQIIVVDGPVHMIVVSTPTSTSVTVTELGYAGDVIGAIAAGATISPSGVGQVTLQAGTSAAMVGGSVTIATATITANSVIMVSRNTLGTADGNLRLENVVVGAPGSFDIVSDAATETSTINWLIVG